MPAWSCTIASATNQRLSMTRWHYWNPAYIWSSFLSCTPTMACFSWCLRILYGSRSSILPKTEVLVFFIILSFGMLLLSNYDLMSLFIKLPSPSTYIWFLSRSLSAVAALARTFSIPLNYRRLYDFFALLYLVSWYRASSDWGRAARLSQVIASWIISGLVRKTLERIEAEAYCRLRLH